MIKEIEKVISNIIDKKYSSADDIALSRLPELQTSIQDMFSTNKNDIEYLQKLEKMRTQFIANVSHELRTPIFAVQGYIETLLNGAHEDPNVNMKFLEKANKHVVNLSNLLNDLIDISMIESGEMRMSFRYFNLYEFLKEVSDNLVHIASKKDLELILKEFDKSLKVLGDKDKLTQVVNNLLQNAIKYTESGKITISVEEDANYANIKIRDTGIGIPDKDLPRIFERFYRVDKARSREYGGTGLGLAICKHIIEAHSSKIEVSSRVNQGSQFSFKLKK